MILVTGAAGKTGLAVTRALKAAGMPVRALIHKKEHRDAVHQAGASQIALGNLLNPEDILQAVSGVQAVYHIPPNIHPREVEIGELLVNAASGAKLEHFVYHSVLHPQIKAMPHHWLKLQVEEYLLESGLPFTILQPAAYMQNITSGLPEILERGTYQVPYPVDTRICLVDLHDVARAAVTVLRDPAHLGAIYELVGTAGLTQREVAQALGKQAGKPIQAQQIPLGYWESHSRQSGLGSGQIDTLVRMFRHYQDFGFIGSRQVLSWLLGREPTSLEDCLARELASLQGE